MYLYGEEVNHTFNTAGTYTVTLRVTDNGNFTDTDTLTVTVTDPTTPTPAGQSISTWSTLILAFVALMLTGIILMKLKDYREQQEKGPKW